MKDIVIIGAGGLGREVAQLIKDINQEKKIWNMLGFIDETVEKHSSIINDTAVLGSFDWIEKENRKNLWAVCALGNPRDKYTLLKKASAVNINYATLIHPDAKINKYSEIGFGCIICCNTFISVNTKIGNHICLNPGCGIGHDTVIEDYSSLYWNVTLSGNVYIHEGCEIGSKATVLPKKSVGKWSVLGAGAVIVKDIPDFCTAVGIPAKPIKFTNPI